MKWRLSDNKPARGVLNRASVWAESEQRPSSGPVRVQRGRRRSASIGTASATKNKQPSRPSSFFGFMSIVGGLGGGSSKAVTPPASPNK